MTGYPKTAWKFSEWHRAMLRNAQVGTPDYGKTNGKSTGSKASKTTRRRRRRRKKKKHAQT